MVRFSHVGLVTDRKQENEIWMEKMRVWVTRASAHPFLIEWLRFAPDSPVEGPVREQPHVGFTVDDLDEDSKGMKVLMEPIWVTENVRIGYYEYRDGAIVELMERKAHT